MEEQVEQTVPEVTLESTEKTVEDQMVEQALNDFKTSYGIVNDLVTKMNGTAVRRVFLAAMSFPLDTKMLNSVQKREEDYTLFTHARTCFGASSVIYSIMMRKQEIQEQINTLNKENEANGTEETV